MIKRIGFVVGTRASRRRRVPRPLARPPRRPAVAKNPAGPGPRAPLRAEPPQAARLRPHGLPVRRRVVQWYESMDAVRTMRSDSRYAEVPTDAAALLDATDARDLHRPERRS